MTDTQQHDWHKKRVAAESGTIRFCGVVRGLEYDIQADLNAHTCIWIDGTLESKAENDNTGFLTKAINFARKAPGGAVALAKANLGIGAVSDTVYSERRAICLSCDRYNGFGVCSECDCYLDAKVRIANQKCPIDKWQKVTIGKTNCEPCKED